MESSPVKDKIDKRKFARKAFKNRSKSKTPLIKPINQ